MYYGIITLSVLMFGVQFYLNDKYQRRSGTGAESVFIFNLLCAVAGVICLSVINKFDFSLTPFTLLMAVVAAIDGLLCSSCSLRALERANLSVYSLFSMLGGMMLPFVAGLIFFDESMTLGKGVCVVLVIAALLLTVNRGKRGGEIYYIGVFIFNGLSGVIATVFERAPYEKATSAGYSVWSAVASGVISLAILALIRVKKKKKLALPSPSATLLALGGGALNRVANLLLLIALAVLPASVQYPFVTGGVMIVSTALAVITKQKPSRREIASVGLAFIGILALVLLP